MPCCGCSKAVDINGQKGDMDKFRGPIIEVEKETIVRLRDVGTDNIATDEFGGKRTNGLTHNGSKFCDEGTDNIATDKNYMGKEDSGKSKTKTFTKYLTMANSLPPLTTHVLDTSIGMPAANMPMILSKQSSPGNFSVLEKGSTNNDGRGSFLSDGKWQPGIYKLHFDTGTYFTSQNVEGFYPWAEVVFTIKDPSQHYHVPLLLSPYGYSTYRGS